MEAALKAIRNIVYWWRWLRGFGAARPERDAEWRAWLAEVLPPKEDA